VIYPASTWLGLAGVGAKRFYGSDVQKRTELEFGRHTVVRYVDSDKQMRTGEHRHLGMAYLVSLAARHHQAERLERSCRKQISEGL
jgi:hypothetical protein